MAADERDQRAPEMLWGDTSRRGRPFAKDPSVIRFQGRYLLYYSIPSYDDGRPNDGWGIGIAESRDLRGWVKVGEFLAAEPYEAKGVAAPFAMVHEGKVHLFYQTYGNGPKDAICHATSSDGLRFERDATNPIFRPTGDWTVGRAIDVEVVRHANRWFLYAATRDPQMKVQMVVGAVSDGGFERSAWRMLADRPLLKPELPWEQDCIEAPTILRRGATMFMFYAGAYNNAPQQVGLARSTDGVTWTRMSNEPFLRNGGPGTWNSSESGHPGVFVDEDGTPYLFYQGNDDKGRTWRLSFVRLAWRDERPVLAGGAAPPASGPAAPRAATATAQTAPPTQAAPVSQAPVPAPIPVQPAAMARWRDARFGMFIHWGQANIPPTTAQRVRLVVERDDAAPSIAEWRLYRPE